MTELSRTMGFMDVICDVSCGRRRTSGWVRRIARNSSRAGWRGRGRGRRKGRGRRRADASFVVVAFVCVARRGEVAFGPTRRLEAGTPEPCPCGIDEEHDEAGP